MKKYISWILWIVIIISQVHHQAGSNLWVITGCIRASETTPCTLSETITISLDGSQFTGLSRIDIETMIAGQLKHEQDRKDTINLPDSQNLTGVFTVP